MFRTEGMKRKKREYDRSNTGPDHYADWKSRCIKEYRDWLIIENRFPYDLVANVHHLLIPKRKFSDYEEMSDGEEEELFQIKKEVAANYDSVIENFHGNRSVHDHFHFHLIKFKPEYTDDP